MDLKNKDHIFNLANSIIGVSILAMPYCFKQCGILLSIFLLIFSSILCRLACHFLLKSAINARLRTFEFLAQHAFGSFGQLFIEIGMIGYLLGTCVAFFVVIGDLGPQIVSELTDTENKSSLRTTILIAIGIFCVLPLGLLRNISSLSGVSLATIGFYLCLVFKIVSEAFPHILAGDWYERVEYWRPNGLLQCLPIFSMALFCQTQIFEIYHEIPNASLDKMNELVRIAVNMCSFVYIFVGTFGYIATSHKEFLSGNILMDFLPTPITQIMKIGFVLSVAVSFPIVIFPCRVSLYSLFFKPVYTSLHESKFYIPEAKFQLLTVLIVGSSLTIGIFIPNIELVLGLVGSTIGVMVCLLFPAGCFIYLTTRNTNERILAQIMLVIGISVMVLGTYANIYSVDSIPQMVPDQLVPHNLEVNVKMIPAEPADKGDKVKHEPFAKEVQIKEPDKVVREEPSVDLKPEPEKQEKRVLDKDVRHEPVQPVEPLEVNNLIKDAKEAPKFPIADENPIKSEETLKLDKKEIKDVNIKEKAVTKKADMPVKKIKPPEFNNKQNNTVAAKNENEKPQEVDASDSAVDVDLEAIKKEDKELHKGQTSENLMEHSRLIKMQQQMFERNKLLLEEIKLRQEKERLDNKDRVEAVKIIESLAKKAIEKIVENRQVPLNISNNENPKSVNVEKSIDVADAAEIVPNPAPLAYQLGLQNNSDWKEKKAPVDSRVNEVPQVTDPPQPPESPKDNLVREEDILLIKHVESHPVIENIPAVKANANEEENILQSNISGPNVKDKSQKESQEIRNVLNADILKTIANNTAKELIKTKDKDNGDHHRDLLSDDYERYKRDVNEENNDNKNNENCEKTPKSGRDLKSVP